MQPRTRVKKRLKFTSGRACRGLMNAQIDLKQTGLVRSSFARRMRTSPCTIITKRGGMRKWEGEKRRGRSRSRRGKEQKESQEDIQVMNFGFPAASSIKTSLSARLMTLCQPPLLWRSRFPFHVYSSVPGFPLRFLLSCRKPSLMIGQITATSRSIVYVCVSLTVRVCVSV